VGGGANVKIEKNETGISEKQGSKNRSPTDMQNVNHIKGKPHKGKGKKTPKSSLDNGPFGLKSECGRRVQKLLEHGR